MPPEVEARFNRLENIVLKLAESVQANQAEMAELKAVIAAERQASQAQMAELREGQSLLVQMFAEERQQFQEFRLTVNRFMDQVDRRLNSLESR